jgi:hypothetical protein
MSPGMETDKLQQKLYWHSTQPWIETIQKVKLVEMAVYAHYSNRMKSVRTN